jgi:hypothetical protein
MLKLVYPAMIILPLTILSACGGDGDESPMNDSGTDNTNGSSTLGDTDTGTTNVRVSRIRYDFDNNGVFEGVREFAYGSDGKILEERYTYSDDGTEDLPLFSSALSDYAAMDRMDETVTYTYDADGRLQTLVRVNSQTRVTSTYTFNDDNLITRVDGSIEDENGAVTSRYSHALTYTGQRLVSHTTTIDDDVMPVSKYEIRYDDAGYVVTNQVIPLQLPGDSNPTEQFNYTYLGNGRPYTITETSLIDGLPDTSATSTNDHPFFEFGYTENNQLSYLNHIYNGTTMNHTFAWLSQYDANGRQIVHQVDEGIDGTIDAIAEIEWEEGVCSSVLSWSPRAIVPDTVDLASPYKPGTGYIWLPHCTSGI